MWKWCSLFFSMFEESCTGNSFLLDRLSIRNFTLRIWGDWERMCEENAQICGDRVTGFSIMTTPQLTQLCLWPGIWPLGWTVVPHPPYSPDLAPCDFFLFLTMKKTLKGKRFATAEEVKTASQEALNNIKLQQFQRCFTQWEKRSDKCIASNGEYFEGDEVFFVWNVNTSFLKKIWFFWVLPRILLFLYTIIYIWAVVNHVQTHMHFKKLSIQCMF